MTQQNSFTVGPPDPVFDSRRLPAVTADEEAPFVVGASLGFEHPDNGEEPTEDEIGLGAATTEEPLSEAELDALVAEVDPHEVDQTGFDDDDLVRREQVEAGAEPVGGGF